MHRIAAVAVVSLSLVTAGCDLGVVDLRFDPSPARITVVSQITTDRLDSERLDITVRALLDPGIGPDGRPRELDSESFVVDGTPHAPTLVDPTGPRSWDVTLSAPTPGPEGIPLSLPRPEGLGPGTSFTMRIRVVTTPAEGAVALGAEDDLVVIPAPPSNPAEAVRWALALRSDSLPGYALRVSGQGPWPDQIRMPAEQLPDDAFPIEATLEISWDRQFMQEGLIPQEGYEVELRSTMRLRWTLERAP